MEGPARRKKYPRELDSFVFDSMDGSRRAFRKFPVAGSSSIHIHGCDEHIVVLQGEYNLLLPNRVIRVGPGQEYEIPAGVPHGGRFTAGTETFHEFQGNGHISYS